MASERAQEKPLPLLQRDSQFLLPDPSVQNWREAEPAPGNIIGTQDSVLYNPGGVQTDSAPDVCPENSLRIGKT